MSFFTQNLLEYRIWKKLKRTSWVFQRPRWNKWHILWVSWWFTFFKPSSLWLRIMTISLCNNPTIPILEMGVLYTYTNFIYNRQLIEGWGCCFCRHYTYLIPFFITIGTQLCLSICRSAFRYINIIAMPLPTSSLLVNDAIFVVIYHGLLKCPTINLYFARLIYCSLF